MSLFGKLIRVTLDTTVRLPVAVVKDVATLGGVIIDEDSAVVNAARKTTEDVKDVVDELEDL